MHAEIVNHKNVDSKVLLEVAKIKDYYWKHGIESQVQWLNNNFSDSDLHILFYYKLKLIAYISINFIECIIDGKIIMCCGIGSVCVDHGMQSKGIGSKAMSFINDYLVENNKIGLLLCNEKNKIFYSKLGWHNIQYNSSKVGEIDYNKNVMAYNFHLTTCNTICFNKNF